MAAGEPWLQLERLGDQAVLALDDGTVPGREEALELFWPEQPVFEVDAISAPQGGGEVVQAGAAHLVVLERPQDRACRDDAEPETRQHRTGSQRAVRTLEGAAVKLGHRVDTGEPGRIEPAGRWRVKEGCGRECEIGRGEAGDDDRNRSRRGCFDEIERGQGGRRSGSRRRLGSLAWGVAGRVDPLGEDEIGSLTGAGNGTAGLPRGCRDNRDRASHQRRGEEHAELREESAHDELGPHIEYTLKVNSLLVRSGAVFPALSMARNS